jgi:hypothetical protein
MAFILWRQGNNGIVEYVSGWAAKGGQAGHSNDPEHAFRYQTRDAADAAVARAQAGWQVREAEEAG